MNTDILHLVSSISGEDSASAYRRSNDHSQEIWHGTQIIRSLFSRAEHRQRGIVVIDCSIHKCLACQARPEGSFPFFSRDLWLAVRALAGHERLTFEFLQKKIIKFIRKIEIILKAILPYICTSIQ